MALSLWFAVFFGFLVWSGINPHDRFTWWLEVAPGLIAFFAMLVTYKTFRLTTLTYVLILVHCVVLFIGAHYTYELVPLGDWVRDLVDGERNNYDKLGHFMQGFVPAIVVREVLLRKGIVTRRGWLAFLVVTTCVGFAAAYEWIEWWMALLVGDGSDAFLGTQGYVWDAQSDMLMCGIGATLSLLTLSWLHDRQIRRMQGMGQQG